MPTLLPATMTEESKNQPEHNLEYNNATPRKTSIAFIKQFARVYSGCCGYDISYYILN